jgi:hypothetical protein
MTTELDVAVKFAGVVTMSVRPLSVSVVLAVVFEGTLAE